MESPSTGDLNAGNTVTLTLNLSGAVTVAGGTPTLTLNDGGTATYTGGSGTNALTFSYTVAAGQNTADPGGDGGQPQWRDDPGRQRQCRQPVADRPDPDRPADRHHDADGVVGGGVGHRHHGRRRRSRRRQRGDADGQPERGGDGCRRHPDADAQRRRHRDLYRRLRHQCADLQLHGGGRPEHRRPGGDGGQSQGAATVKDGAGNAANLTGAVTNPAGTLQIDTTAPTVSSVVASGTGITAGAGDLGAGSVVTLTVNLSEAVTVAGGTPTLTLNDGGTATYTGGSGTNALTFSYTVAAGQNTADLAVTAVNLGTATVKDGAGNAANLTGAVTNPAGTLQIDTTAPSVSSVVASGTGITAGSGDLGSRQRGDADGEPERGGDGCRRHADADAQRRRHRDLYRRLRHQCADLQLHGGGRPEHRRPGGDRGQPAVRRTVKDGAGNAANLTGAVTNPAGTLQIDTTAPTVSSVVASGTGITAGAGDLSDGSVVTLTVNLNEAVTVAGGTPTLTLNDGGTATYTGGSGTNALTFSYTVAAGQNTADLAVTAVNLDTRDRQGRRRQCRQSHRRGDHPGRHAADRHHGADGVLGGGLGHRHHGRRWRPRQRAAW